MSFQPNATQAQALLRLLFIPEEPAISKLRPALPVDKRKELIDAGLIALEKRGRTQHLLLTDRGWAWSADNLRRLCPKTLNQLRPEILAAILEAFGKNMTLRELSLAELVRPEMLFDAPLFKSSASEQGAEHLPSRILLVCQQLTEGRPGDRIRLADLRNALPDIERSLLDETLLMMQSTNEVVLSTLERFEINTNDKAAEIRVAGLPRHVIYLK